MGGPELVLKLGQPILLELGGEHPTSAFKKPASASVGVLRDGNAHRLVLGGEEPGQRQHQRLAHEALPP